LMMNGLTLQFNLSVMLIPPETLCSSIIRDADGKQPQFCEPTRDRSSDVCDSKVTDFV